MFFRTAPRSAILVTPQLRRPTEADFRVIRDIAWRSWAAAYRKFLPEEDRSRFFAQYYTKDGHRRALASRRTLFLLAEDERGPMAFVLATEDAGRVHLHRLYADPSRQRSGAGQALWNELVRWARARGASRIGFEVASEGESGPRFYEKQGCRRVDETTMTVGRLPVRVSRYVFDVSPALRGR
jgi:ribosomal protein S18 acetylase RimI-like enzyme